MLVHRIFSQQNASQAEQQVCNSLQLTALDVAYPIPKQLVLNSLHTCICVYVGTHLWTCFHSCHIYLRVALDICIYIITQRCWNPLPFHPNLATLRLAILLPLLPPPAAPLRLPVCLAQWTLARSFPLPSLSLWLSHWPIVWHLQIKHASLFCASHLQQTHIFVHMQM